MPNGDTDMLDTVLIDDLNQREATTAISREILRAIGLQGLYTIQLQGEHLASHGGTLAMLRLILSITSGSGVDTIFFASQHLAELDSGLRLPERDNKFSSQISGYNGITRTLELLSGVFTADSYSPTTDSTEYLQLSIDSLCHLLADVEKRYRLRYAHDGLLIEVPPVDRFFTTPLWADDEALPDQQEHWILTNQPATLDLILAFDEHPKIWSFWREWYQGFLDGSPLDWELQRQVALIETHIWDAGPEAVAVEIEKIRARQDVRDALNDLPEVDVYSVSDRHGIGGNAPPEALEDVAKLVSQTTIIWAGVEALEKEAYAEKPDRDRILAAVAILQSGAAACLKWFGRKADLTVDTLIKWGVPAGAAHLLMNQQKIQTLIDAATKWAGLQ